MYAPHFLNPEPLKCAAYWLVPREASPISLGWKWVDVGVSSAPVVPSPKSNHAPLRPFSAQIVESPSSRSSIRRPEGSTQMGRGCPSWMPKIGLHPTNVTATKADVRALPIHDPITVPPPPTADSLHVP